MIVIQRFLQKVFQNFHRKSPKESKSNSSGEFSLEIKTFSQGLFLKIFQEFLDEKFQDSFLLILPGIMWEVLSRLPSNTALNSSSEISPRDPVKSLLWLPFQIYPGTCLKTFSMDFSIISSGGSSIFLTGFIQDFFRKPVFL